PHNVITAPIPYKIIDCALLVFGTSVIFSGSSGVGVGSPGVGVGSPGVGVGVGVGSSGGTTTISFGSIHFSSISNTVSGGYAYPSGMLNTFKVNSPYGNFTTVCFSVVCV